ncbi:MAG: SusC/RagA family TonB-linked outer membrane protein, partial [Bacteroidales bacterium]|nr:SusC/RagA family TonB-linked outer membrane protein [Bacteroidales bacterium]
MKNKFAIIFLAAAMLLPARGLAAASSGNLQEKTVSVNLDLRKATLKSFAEAFRSQTGVVFSFESETGATPVGDVSIHRTGASVEDLLEAALAGKGLSWKIVNNTVAVVRIPASAAKTDGGTVSGQVVDGSGDPVPGAVVMKVGEPRSATVTDLDGRYNMEGGISQATVLEVSCLGFTTVTEAVRGRKTVNFTLEESSTVLNETVIVGYGVQKKVNLTGSVAQVNFTEALDSRPVMNTSSALGGLVAGMQVRQSSGQPGSDSAAIRIRGNTTLNNNSPLVLVDGVEWSMDDVNPNDIASISVLKDAASTAIYGSRAGAGVILITTKLGSRKDYAKVTYSFNGIWQRPYNRLGWISDYVTHMKLVNESRENMDQPAIFSDQTIAAWEYANAHPDETNEYGVPNKIAFPNTDWFSEIFSTGFSQEHNVSVEGSTGKAKYLISLGYLDNEGVMNRFESINSGTKKINFRANVEGKVSDWITVGTRIFGNRQSYGLANVSNAFSYIYQTTPGVAPGEPGAWGSAINKTEEASTANNIFSQMRGSDGHKLTYRLNASAYARFTFFKDLNLELTGNYAPTFSDNNTYSFNNVTWNYTSNTMVSESKLSNATNSNSYSHADRVNFDALLRYDKEFGLHSIGAVAGYSTNYYHTRSFSVSKIGSPDWSITEMSSYTDVLGTAGSSSTEWSLMSFFGRVNYSFADKYLLEANVRADGSSRFSPQMRWGYFPSFSAGWRIDQEPFMSSLDWLDMLKLRASWGVTGNNGSGNYSWQATYSTVNVVVNRANTKGLLQTALGNELLLWEP